MKVIRKFVKKILGDKPEAEKPTKKSSSGGSKKGGSTGSKSRRSPAKAKTSSSSNGSKSKSRTRKSTGRGSQEETRSSQSKRGSRTADQKKRSASTANRKNSRKSANSKPNKSSRSDRAAQERVNAGGGRRVARPSGSSRRGSGSSRRKRPGGGASVVEREKHIAEHAEWSLDSFTVEPAPERVRFHDFDLPSEIMHAVSDLKFEYCTPIQALSLGHALVGKNVAGRAQTGTGKTAAFLIAILTRYLRSPENKQERSGAPRALVIAPTRELVIQICQDAASLGKYCGLRTLAVYGGMDYQRQQDEIQAEPIDLLVATPGRLLDYSRRRVIDLSQVDTLVIDEADRMLDMGFIPDVRMIMNKLPRKDKRCTMLYSATLTQDVMRLAAQWMEKPVSIEVEPENVTTDTVEQIVYVVTATEKFTVLYNLLQQHPEQRILVFCNRKVTTESIVRKLRRLNIACDMLSGDVNQNRRLRVLEDFREGKSRIVIATDVAGRGIHVDDIGFVVNYDFPYEAEDYVHRIGRTGRAGNQGTAVSFADEDESFIIPDIEEYIGEPLKCTILLGSDPLMADIPRPGRQRLHNARTAKPATDSSTAQPAADAEQKTKKSPEKGSEKVEKPQTAQPTEKSESPESPSKRSSRAQSTGGRGRKKPAAKPRREYKSKKPAEKQAAKPAARQVAKPVERQAAKPAARQAAKPAARQAAKPAARQAAKPARRPRFSDEWVPGQ